MNEAEHLASACSGKRRFESFGLAQSVAKRSNRRHDGAHLHPYHCRHCRGFHVGQHNGHSGGRRPPRAETVE